MRICVIASSRFPISQPFAGGLEAWTHSLVGELDRRGHQVTLFAAPGSDPSLPVEVLPVSAWRPSDLARTDVNAPPEVWIQEHHAYLDLMLGLARAPGRFDVIHNSSLHHLPVAMASMLSTPLITTLHTPPIPWLESAVAVSRGHGTYVAVSKGTARSWSSVVPASVICNGVDVARFREGAGGGPAVWAGRLVPEKAPHEAIDAARLAGQEIVLAGPPSDPAYVEQHVLPRLGDGATYAGHLGHADLIRLVGSASVAVVTPAWDEPYGLVAAEALACGTPVAAYARGALPEILTTAVGALARPGDTHDLARAVRAARRLDRRAARRHAEEHCSLTAMVDAYERVYASRGQIEAA